MAKLFKKLYLVFMLVMERLLQPMTPQNIKDTFLTYFQVRNCTTFIRLMIFWRVHSKIEKVKNPPSPRDVLFLKKLPTPR